MHRFEAQPSFILHTRSYRETSLLLEIFTLEYGRVGAVAKGVKGLKTRAQGVLQPFVPLLVACVGRGELLTLKAFESAGIASFLTGRRLVCALYLNELLMRLLHRFDPNAALFHSYHQALQALATEKQEQPVLRVFEKHLLKTLGYELPLLKEAETGHEVKPEQFYHFDPLKGPLLVEGSDGHAGHLFKGQHLLAFAADDLHDTAVLLDAKRLMRQALAHHLGHRPLESGKLL